MKVQDQLLHWCASTNREFTRDEACEHFNKYARIHICGLLRLLESRGDLEKLSKTTYQITPFGKSNADNLLR